MKHLFLLFFFLPSIAWAQTAPPPATSTPPGNPFGTPCSYPNSARDAGIQGRTDVAYQIGGGGSIGQVALDSSSGNTDLDNAAIDCVINWTPSQMTQAMTPGRHHLTINWNIPAATAGTPAKKAAGWLAVPPHNCLDYYPASALGMGIGGGLIVAFNIETDGSVTGQKVKQSSGNKDFDNAALECVAHWHYYPATRNGILVEVPWLVRIVFGPSNG